MRWYGGLLEPRVSNLTPLKSTFNAEHFMCRLSWSILNGFGAIVLKCVLEPKIAKIHHNPLFWGVQGCSRSSMLVPLKARQQCLLW